MLSAKVGDVSVKVKGLDALMDRIAAVYRPVTEALERFGTARLEAARARWPVSDQMGKVHSRDRLKATVTLSQVDEVRVVITSPAPYTKYIRARNLGGKNPWIELVRKPTAQRMDDLALRVGDYLKRA